MDEQKFIKRTLLFNPIILLVYAVACYYLADLMQYGGVASRMPIIISMFALLLVWILFYFFYYRKKELATSNFSKKIFKIWSYLGIAGFILITGFTGYDIYQSSIPYQGKLSWFVADLRDELQTSEIPFEKDNIFEDGIDGLIQDLDEEFDLPEELYVANEFELSYQKDGTITNISGTLFGQNTEEQIDSYTISYDSQKKSELVVQLDKNVDYYTLDENKKLQPLIEGVKSLPLEKLITEYSIFELGNVDLKTENFVFNIFYSGNRNWERDTSGIIFYNQDEILGHPEAAYKDITGYTISIYSEDDEATIPERYVYTNANTLEEAVGTIDNNEYDREFSSEAEYYIDDSIGYQLVVLDAAAGSRFYGLTKTENGGQNWEMINEDPFNGSTGGATGVTFIDEGLGFIGLSHSGGTYADLYRTTDGGNTFKIVSLPEAQIPLNQNEAYNPFVFPEMPYEEDGRLMLIVNQGAEGDYNGGVKARYFSTDDGNTWSFIGEIHE